MGGGEAILAAGEAGAKMGICWHDELLRSSATKVAWGNCWQAGRLRSMRGLRPRAGMGIGDLLRSKVVTGDGHGLREFRSRPFGHRQRVPCSRRLKAERLTPERLTAAAVTRHPDWMQRGQHVVLSLPEADVRVCGYSRGRADGCDSPGCRRRRYKSDRGVSFFRGSIVRGNQGGRDRSA